MFPQTFGKLITAVLATATLAITAAVDVNSSASHNPDALLLISQLVVSQR